MSSLQEEFARIRKLEHRRDEQIHYQPPQIDGVTLWPDQLAVLDDLHRGKGSVAAYGVGNGKTWISLLAGHAAGAKRPLVLVPSRLLRKTKIEFGHMAALLPAGFEVPTVAGYEWVRHPNQLGFLDKYAPDLIVCDEAHDLRNNRAQTTTLVAHYCLRNKVQFLAMSGTLLTSKVADLHTVSLLALGEKAPVPLSRSRCEQLDELFAEGGGTKLCSPWLEPGDTPFQAFRRNVTRVDGFRYRPSQGCDAGIEVSLVHAEATGLGDEVRGTGEYQGQELGEWDAKRTAVMLDWGYYHDHRPPPPREWWSARKAWFDVVERLTSADPTLLGAGHVVWHGLTSPADQVVRERWLEAKRKWPTVSVPTWVVKTAVARLAEALQQRAKAGPLLVWYWHAELGRELARQLGWPCYGSQGDCEFGGGNLHARAFTAHNALASAPALGVGSNLQAWSRAALLEPYANPTVLEQLLGRHHRSGQTADTVEFAVFSCRPTLLGRLRGMARSEGKAKLGTKLALATFIVGEREDAW